MLWYSGARFGQRLVPSNVQKAAARLGSRIENSTSVRIESAKNMASDHVSRRSQEDASSWLLLALRNSVVWLNKKAGLRTAEAA